MNTQKYVQAIADATGITGETLGAVRLGIQLAVNDQMFAQDMLRSDLEHYRGLVSEQDTIVTRLQGLEDKLLAWLDKHGKDLPIMLASDYDQYLADVVIEVLNQQRVTILTQHEAIAAQKEAMGRMRQPPIVLSQQNGHLVAGTDSASSRNGHVVVLPNAVVADPTVPADWTHGEALYVELHRLARDGAGPSKPRYDDERAHGMPTASEVIAKAGKRWFAILKDAGLKAPIRALPGPVPTEAAPDGDATFRD